MAGSDSDFKGKKQSERSAYAYQKIVQTGWMAYQEADHPVFLQNNSEIIQKKSKTFCYSVSWVLYVRR